MKIKGIRKLSLYRLRIGQPLSGANILPDPVTISIVQSPSAITVSTGSTALFSCSGVSSENSVISYNWQRSTDNSNFTFISNAKNRQYTTGVLTIADNNSYFRCALSAINSNIAYTNSALLSVYEEPTNYIGWYVIQ